MAEVNPEHVEEAVELQREKPHGYTVEEAEKMTQMLMYLAEENGGTLAAPSEALEALVTSGKVGFIDWTGEETVFAIIEDQPTRKAQAILDGGPEWLESVTGRAARVTGAVGDMIAFVREEEPGRWGDPLHYHADCFLRDHVLAAGVPLLDKETP